MLLHDVAIAKFRACRAFEPCLAGRREFLGTDWGLGLAEEGWNGQAGGELELRQKLQVAGCKRGEFRICSAKQQ